MNTWKWCGVIGCGLLIATATAENRTSDQTVGGDLPRTLRVAGSGFSEGVLKQRGYSSETLEQLRKAMKSKSAAVRWSALRVVATRFRKDAVPVLREGLQDSDVRVRTDAALLLGLLGDRSGIAVLRRDMATLAPGNVISDPNLEKLQGDELDRAKSRRYDRLQGALHAAMALSELGDPNGLELCARMALEVEYSVFRMDAIMALTDLAVFGKPALASQAIEPESILVAVAESETDPSVLRSLMRSAARLRPTAAITILEKVMTSPHLPEVDRKGLQDRLNYQIRRQSEEERGGPIGAVD